ncbi:MAG TPA: phosphotransferase family protein [Vicinamibacterales bacterium]|nr:phosphotransferase family protein [Vicinamibacterales bacterium]
MHGDTRDVRRGEELDRERLSAYLRWHLADDDIPGLHLGEDMEVSQFPGGHSNLTYLIRFGGGELVLRRPPLGPLPPRAHDMAREYRWLAALHPVFPLAPRPYLLCEDPDVLGCVFYVMERRRGLVVRGDEPMPLAGHPERRQQLSESMIDTLADLHRVDIEAPGIAGLGRPIGFLDRQVRGWTERWTHAKLDALPAMDSVALWLAAHQPPETLEAAIVHGDFKIDNVLLDPLDPSRLVAVFDWEMAALGDPLVDVGILLAYWTIASDVGQADALASVTDRPGYLGRDALVERYSLASGRDLSDIAFYETFAVFKIAVVIQQIYARYRRGQTADARFAGLGERVEALAHRALTLTSGA